MLVTILLLILTLFVVPFISFYYGTPLNEIQSAMLYESSMIAVGVALYCFIVSEIAKNYSQVDKLWSVVPFVYGWYITANTGFDPRMVLMSVLATIWGLRLSYNFARRGGYSWKFWEGEEDYRWEVLRKRKGFSNPIVWKLFNFFFICFYQHGLIYLFSIPILYGLSDNAAELYWADYVLAAIFVVLVVIEYIADQQQWDFQTEKYRRINSGEDLGEYAHGFVRTGLWGLSRHPNYGAEQAIWVVYYLFSVAATGEWINWTAAGMILLFILFKSSSDFSEEISAGKYPEYKDYQQKVPRFIPFLKF